MTDLTREQIEQALADLKEGTPPKHPWHPRDFETFQPYRAKTVATILNAVVAGDLVPAHALAKAQAAQAATVEQAAEMAAEIHSSLAAAIRSIADPTGVEALAALRAERDRMNQWRETAIVERDFYSEERDDALARQAPAAVPTPGEGG